MATDYNSSLLSELVFPENDDRLIEVLKEIAEIADPIFIYPLVKSYKLNKNKWFSSHYAEAIGKNKDLNNQKFLEEIILDPTNNRSDIVFFLEFVNYQNYRSVKLDDFVFETYNGLLATKEIKGTISPFDFDILLEYLTKSDEVTKLLPSLELIISEQMFENEIITLALHYFLKIKPYDYRMKFLIDNISKFYSKHIERAIAKEIINWKGKTVDELKSLIKEKGSSRAKEIIENSEKKKEEEKSVKIQSENKTFVNMPVIESIITLRKRINLKTQSSWNFELLSPTEDFFLQARECLSLSELKGVLLSFNRELISKMDKGIELNGFTEEESLELIPGCIPSDLSKPINKLFLFLKSKKINVDLALYGLRDINNIVNKVVAHSGKKVDLIDTLKKFNLWDKYNKEKWEEIHSEILQKYEKFLKSLDENTA